MAHLTLTQEQIKSVLPTIIKSNVVPMITGSSGTGKSSIVQAVADELNLKLIDIRVSQLMPYDLAGLITPNADRTRAGYLPVDVFPLDTDTLPINPKTQKPHEGFLIFFDEFNSGDRSTIAAAYKVVLDRKIGEHNLHPNTRIVCAGNRIQDNAIVNRLGSAMQSRMIHLEMSLNKKEFMEYVTNANWNNILTSYFRFRPDNIHNFDPTKLDEVITFATPRSWEFVNKLLQNDLLNQSKDIIYTTICGSVGEQAGHDFMSYLQIYKDLPQVSVIEKDPTKAPLPDQDNIGAKWAMTAYLADKFNTANEQALVTYIERMREDDLKVLAYRMAVTKYTKLIHNTTVLQRLKGIRSLLSQQP